MSPPRLLLIRHAKAEQHSPTGRDTDRPLAPRGERQADWLAHALAADEHWRPTRVLASPATRCQHTAAAIARACDLAIDTTDTLSLASRAGRIADLADQLAGAALQSGERSCIALVSHQPHLASVIAALTAGPTAHEPRVRTGECFALERAGDEPLWTLRATFRADE